MARIETDPNYSSPTFPRATAATDLFKKEDVQQLAAAMSAHVHDGTGKGLPIVVTSAMIQDLTIVEGDVANNLISSVGSRLIANGAIDNAKLQDVTITSGKISDGAIITSKISGHAVSQTYTIQGSNGSSTTSTGSVIIPATALIFQTIGYAQLLTFTTPIYTSASPGVYIYLYVDSSVVSSLAYVNMTAALGTVNVAGAYVMSGLTPGINHRFELGWSTSTGTVTLNGAAPTVLTVLDVAR